MRGFTVGTQTQPSRMTKGYVVAKTEGRGHKELCQVYACMIRQQVVKVV